MVERDRIEQSIRQAEDKEKREKTEKRQKLIEASEVDRREKREHQKHLRTLQPQEAEHNLVSKFFNRPMHKAYDYRAKQEEISQKIGDQFLSPKSKTFVPSSSQAETKDFDSAAKDRLAQRRAKELEIKRAQDEQVEAKERERARLKQQQRDYRDRVINEAKQQATEDDEKKRAKIDRNLKH